MLAPAALVGCLPEPGAPTELRTSSGCRVSASSEASGAAPAALLENYANNFSPGGLRSRRYERRSALWSLTNLPRLGKCGRVPNGSLDGRVGLRATGTVVGFSGLCTCGSVWACPVCSAKVMSRRALEIGGALAEWHARSGLLVFGTFTMRHRKSDRLEDLWDAVQKAWNRVTAGKSWLADKSRYGVTGWVRVVEVTYGRNGWHVHVHAVFLVDGKQTDTTAAAFHSSMFGRWSAGIQAAGFRAPLLAGQNSRLVRDSQVSELAAYFSKAVDLPAGKGAQGASAPSTSSGAQSLALELTQSQSKAARSSLGTVPPWRLLDRVVEDGDADALDVWHLWEAGSKGRRQISWSMGLRDLLGVGREASDDEIAGEELGGHDLVLITADGWRAMVRDYVLIPQLLAVTESGGLSAARKFLVHHRIEFLEV